MLKNYKLDSEDEKITGIDDYLIVINDRKLRINYNEEIDSLNRIINQFNNKVSDNCKETLINNSCKAKHEKNFGNGRYVRNLFEKAKFEQANRVIQTKSKTINSLTNKDSENATTRF